MVENIFEELDASGEWFYRKSTGELFFYPPSGTDLSSATIELASQTSLFRVVGTSATATVQYLTFKGITFTGTYRTLFSKTYEPLLQGRLGHRPRRCSLYDQRREHSGRLLRLRVRLAATASS